MLVMVAHGARLSVELVEFLDGANLLLLLHASVLEPDLDLTLGEVERDRQFDATPTRQIAAVVEFLLQFERLVASVRLPTSPPLRRIWSCTNAHI